MKAPTVKRVEPEFLKGPIPILWIGKTFPHHRRTILTALTAWHLYELNKRAATFKYSYSMAQKFGLNRISAWRGLSDLTDLGLIKAKTMKGSSPFISIVMDVQNADK